MVEKALQNWLKEVSQQPELALAAYLLAVHGWRPRDGAELEWPELELRPEPGTFDF